MNELEEKLKKYILDNKINASHHVFADSTHSVEEAALAVNGSASDFVKSICLIDKDGNLVVSIVKGEDKINMKKIRKLLNSSYLKSATPEEILERTGYVCGGVPPFGYKAIFLVDNNVLDNDFVYSGGGSQNSLVKISPGEIIRVNNGQIVEIRKE